MDVMLFLQYDQNEIKFWFFKVLKIIVGEYFDSYSLMFSNSDVFAKTNLGRSWKSVNYAFENYILITQFTVHREIFTPVLFSPNSPQKILVFANKKWFYSKSSYAFEDSNLIRYEINWWLIRSLIFLFFHAIKNYLKYSMNNEGMLNNFGSFKLHLVRYEV